ncbi:MAG: DUF4157 domain-containing protein [Burkholderiales bacterium]|nr:DUF4157 domain-containing protein [Burkholderiales bacterium]
MAWKALLLLSVTLSCRRVNPLPETERAFFERRMGADFSNVRVHTDSDAQRLSQQINAHAFWSITLPSTVMRIGHIHRKAGGCWHMN